MDERVLVVNHETAAQSWGAEYTAASWTNRYTILDQNIVFLDLDSIVTQLEEASDSTTIVSPNSDSIPPRLVLPSPGDIINLLQAGNDLWVFLPRKRYVELPQICDGSANGTEPIDLLGWLPLEVRTENRSRSVDKATVNSELEQYFSRDMYPMRVDGVYLKEEMFQGQTILDSLLSSPLASTPSDEPLALKVRIQWALDITQAFAPRSDYEWSKDKMRFPGTVYFLPPNVEIDSNKAVREILTGWYGADLDAIDSDPSWLTEYELPRQREIRGQFSELQSEAKELRREFQDLKQFEALLVGKDADLERAVRRAFEVLDFETTDEIAGKRDGTVRIGDTEFVLEISGSKQPYGSGKCRQLHDWVEQAQTDPPDMVESNSSDIAISGLLVTNAPWTDPPGQRPSPIESEGIRFLEKRGYKALASDELYRWLEWHQSGELTSDEIANHILTSEDVIIKLSEKSESN